MGERLLVTGARGYIGGHVMRLASGAIGLGREAGDITEIGPRIETERPSSILHLAALSGIGDCAADPDEARRVNVEGTRVVASAARRVRARLVHVSTDQVFHGTAPPYREEDEPTPISVYGETKAAGEQVALDAGGEDVLVVRLHLVVGRAVPPRRSGTDRFLEAAAAGDRPTLFTDEFRSPIEVRDVARALIELAALDARGILHLGGPERLSRLEIGRHQLRAAGLDPETARAGSIAGYDGPPRTPDTSFDSSRAFALLRTPIRPIGEALRA